MKTKICTHCHTEKASELYQKQDAPVFDAVFVGYQENLPGLSPIALYGVEKIGHPLFKSTVSAKTLTANGLSFSAPPETL